MSMGSQVVVLGMFDVTRLDRAMPVRIHNLCAALQALTPTTLIAGGWMARRRAIFRYLLHGGLRRTRAVYVEASTTTATETDLLFLALLHLAHVPILVFIPDAYQLFPDVFPRSINRIHLMSLSSPTGLISYTKLPLACLPNVE